MNVYQAIMQAADRIESRPDRFDFDSCGIPSVGNCGTIGCALGWIGACAGLPLTGDISAVAGHRYPPEKDGSVERSLLQVEQIAFYWRMDDIEYGWAKSAHKCAKALRLYAQKYHAPESRPGSAFAADLITRVMGEKIPEAAPSPELVP